ncbi:AAA family ATPase [Pseudonocardia spinosispora]|uniref:AAA family ATPase n=1 Tax=Pseudonocardia spinosispora TaxID=103441 RepID=UPI001FDEF78A|nr:AAA family ATPase [Pseudonocardia spinosispora]
MPRRCFVLVAGIPGAGKSTLLRRLRATSDDAVVLDSDPIREQLRKRLPEGTPYRRYRPLVHLWHRLHIVAAVLLAVGPVVVHLPATGAITRGAMMLLALLAFRSRYLVWVHADTDQARQGQHSRGRVLGGSCFERHARRGEAFVQRLRVGYRPKGWRSTALLDRDQARHGLVLATDQ